MVEDRIVVEAHARGDRADPDARSLAHDVEDALAGLLLERTLALEARVQDGGGDEAEREAAGEEGEGGGGWGYGWV